MDKRCRGESEYFRFISGDESCRITSRYKISDSRTVTPIKTLRGAANSFPTLPVDTPYPTPACISMSRSKATQGEKNVESSRVLPLELGAEIGDRAIR